MASDRDTPPTKAEDDKRPSLVLSRPEVREGETEEEAMWRFAQEMYRALKGNDADD